MAFCQGGFSSGWSFISVVFHWRGHLPVRFFNGVIFHKSDLSSGRSTFECFFFVFVVVVVVVCLFVCFVLFCFVLFHMDSLPFG